ncbi:hypothetical protein OQ519_00145 [Pseudomonas lurida]|uniref:hypothetical protein n=1 Tax=Pseudomonas TaxID=286 RepID=UPI0005A4C29C|nr:MULTISPECIES: hypothetical protein [Pseudomonas]KGS13309.1 hypothetical protein OA77_17225 [Pseudomonas coronafaciens]MBD8666382.1 hypothetical protein [Pseudomonas lurida]RMV07264.1 hypothetical protein ALP20_00010 [Pseudomonas coronafaciens pv. coronafaciens]UZQ74781.1 hypothetical protein OQ519_00145 [Pseudomonas lurida]
MLESELERQIWSLAASVYGPELEPTVVLALKQYRRRPGLDDPTRIYQSSMEPSAFQALARALVANDHPGLCLERGYIEMRSGLRWHLTRHLQQVLIQDQHATDAMRDNYFAADLGL